jgi:hypothetical protein
MDIMEVGCFGLSQVVGSDMLTDFFVEPSKPVLQSISG